MRQILKFTLWEDGETEPRALLHVHGDRFLKSFPHLQHGLCGFYKGRVTRSPKHLELSSIIIVPSAFELGEGAQLSIHSSFCRI